MTSARNGVRAGSGERRARLARAREVLRVHIVRTFWFKALAATAYRRVVVMECRLDAPIVQMTARAPVIVGLLTEADVDEYATFRPDADAAEIRRRLVAGHRCFVARHEGRIVHAGWAATREAWIEFLGRPFPLEPGDVYQFDSYTAPAFRGLDLATARVTWMARFLRDAGFRRLLAVVWPENRAAFRPLEKAGYRAVGTMGYIRLACWQRHFYRRKRPSAPPP